MNKKKTFEKVIMAVAMVACVGFTSCLDEKDMFKKPVDQPTEFNEFDFSTKKSVEFTLKYDVPTGYPVPFEMYTKAPITLDDYKSYVKDSTLVSFYSGTSDEEGGITFKGDLPATVDEIYAYSSGIGVPVLLKASVNETGAVSDFVEAEILTTKSTRASGTPSGTKSWTTYNVTVNKPTLTPVSRDIKPEDKKMIDKSFQVNQNYDVVGTYYQPSIRLTGKANVKIYSVSHGTNSNRTNALAYFVYNESDELIKPADVNNDLKLVFPELNKNRPAEGQGYQLLNGTNTEFEAGSHIGFALFPDITPGNLPTTNANVLYSCFNTGAWNIYAYDGLYRASVPHMVLSLLREDSDGHAIIAIGFEDQPWSTKYGTNRGDFRDDIFILEIDPATSLPGDLPKPPTDEPDYNTEFTSSGILCFEDCWPAKGDYDMNDIVLAYERRLCISYASGPVALKETFTFLHNGASFMNGFGYQLVGLQQTDVLKCTVTSDGYTWDRQGLDKDSNEAMVMLFDNGKEVEKGTTFSVYTSFNNGGNMIGVNPFIVVRGGNYATSTGNSLSSDRTEVHLPTLPGAAMTERFFPTSKSTSKYWNTQDDRSIPTKNVYYVREGNYPFALELAWDSDEHGPAATNFVIPKDSKSIDETYPNFVSWVTSNKKTNTDWFYHPKE